MQYDGWNRGIFSETWPPDFLHLQELVSIHFVWGHVPTPRRALMSQQPPFKKKNIPHLIQMKILATDPMAEFVIERYHICVGYVPEAYRTVYMGKFITALETSQPSSRHKLRHKVF
jgi:hypothetical protein